MASLCIKFPDRRGEMTHLLEGQRITIGRTPDNTIQIIDRTVSGHHAELVLLNGHYRLHDLGSTNLTCVDGQPITDYHMHHACKVLFGTVECEFVPTSESIPEKVVAVPTRAEIDFLQRENEEMKASVQALGKQIEILNSARLVTRESAVPPVSPEEHRKLTTESIALRSENESLRSALEGLKADLAAVTRDRDGILQAWETLKREAERRQVDEKPKAAPQPPQSETSPAPEAKGVTASVEAESTVPANAPPTAMSESAPATAVDGECAPQSVMLPAAQAATAEVLAQTPPLIESLRVALAEAGKGQTRNDVILRAAALLESLQEIQGHPVHRLVQSIEALLHDPYAFTAGPMLTLHQAGDLAHLLTGHKHLEPSKTLSQPRVLVIDDDEELVAALTATFEAADIPAMSASSPGAALSILQSHPFDLILLDIAMPEKSGIELCPKIHEILGSRKTPIVFLTASDTLENRAQASLSGGNDFISKPFNTRELTLKAQLWIYRYQLSLM